MGEMEMENGDAVYFVVQELIVNMFVWFLPRNQTWTSLKNERVSRTAGF